MIILGNREFVIGMKFCGVRNSFIVDDREQCLKVIDDLPKNEFVIANVSVVELVPELKKFRNLATIPDNVSELDSIEDLKYIIKTAVGIELEVV